MTLKDSYVHIQNFFEQLGWRNWKSGDILRVSDYMDG